MTPLVLLAAGALLGAIVAWALTRQTSAIDAALRPIRDGLAKYEDQLHRIEKDRVESFATLSASIATVRDMGAGLQLQTTALARAMSGSGTRGAWGEIQLKRICELAGMLDHCDFTTQVSTDGADGRLRPDLIVHLPAGRKIVVDAKVPFDAYYAGMECEDPIKRMASLKAHAARVRQHAAALSKKSYWEQFQPAPEFVVMFLPAESFFSAALEGDPALIEECVRGRVVLAAPTTLIGLLMAVSYGWRQEQMAANAERIRDLAQELYKRIRTFGEHYDGLGDSLGKAVTAYNRSVGSLEGSILPLARRFNALGAATGDGVAELAQIELIPRELEAPELREGALPPRPGLS